MYDRTGMNVVMMVAFSCHVSSVVTYTSDHDRVHITPHHTITLQASIAVNIPNEILPRTITWHMSSNHPSHHLILTDNKSALGQLLVETSLLIALQVEMQGSHLTDEQQKRNQILEHCAVVFQRCSVEAEFGSRVLKVDVAGVGY